MKAATIKLDPRILRMDGGTQSRARLNTTTISEYMDVLREGEPFKTNVVAFYDGTYYWLADGFHRVNAAISADHRQIEVDVKQGDKRAAILFSVGANHDHGLPRTREDKQRAVAVLLADPEWSKWSDRKIAETCHVSPTTVGAARSVSTVQIGQSPSRKGADGRTINVTNIGKAKPKASLRIVPMPTSPPREPSSETRTRSVPIAMPPAPVVMTPASRVFVDQETGEVTDEADAEEWDETLAEIEFNRLISDATKRWQGASYQKLILCCRNWAQILEARDVRRTTA